MSPTVTLLFVCNQSQLYSVFISAFSSADFQVLLARNLTHAKRILQGRRVEAIVLRHDCHRDDRPLASPLKRVVPQVPIFLVTDQPQLRQPDIQSVWRGETGDEVVSRAMALFFRQCFKGTRLSQAGRQTASEKGVWSTAAPS